MVSIILSNFFAAVDFAVTVAVVDEDHAERTAAALGEAYRDLVAGE